MSDFGEAKMPEEELESQRAEEESQSQQRQMAESSNKSSEKVARAEDDDDALPLACPICKTSFLDPVVTDCDHYFCKRCALKHHKNDATCFVCKKPTLGVYKPSVEMKNKIAKVRENLKPQGGQLLKRQKTPNQNQKQSSAVIPSSKRSTEPPSLLSLPSDLHEMILCRVPAEDILESKRACKAWNALIKNLITKDIFIQNHLDHCSSSSQRLLRSRLPEEFQKPIEVILHCDGLVLCLVEQQVAIWNPTLKVVRWIKGCLWSKTLLGIGYKNRREGYMILSVPDMRFKLVTAKKPVRIYDLKNATWRNLDNLKVDWVLDSSSPGVAAMGNMYWVAQDKNLESCIQGFDFSVEEFKTVCFCPPLSCYGYRFLSCFSKDQLSLLHQEINSGKIEVWVSNKLSDETVSFSMHFSVQDPGLPSLKLSVICSDPVYCFVKPKNIVAWCVRIREGARYCLALYDVGEDGVREQAGSVRNSETLLTSYFSGNVYIPTLVPLPA